MAAQITFWGGDWGAISIDGGGSGLGLYGSTGFGASVGVGSFQSTTYVTDSNGTIQGLPIHNIQWISNISGVHSDNTAINYPISGIPNSKATLNVRFTNDTAVKCQNVKARFFDRTLIDNAPSGVQAYLAELVQPEILNPNFTTSGPFGSGTSWQLIYGSSAIMTIKNQSPGPSGKVTMNPNFSDTRHDWYFALSASQTSIGSKYFALYFSLEYL